MSTATAESLGDDTKPLSPWWVRWFIIVFVIGAAVLVAMTVLGYKHAPPIPQSVVSSDGTTLFTRADIENGQGVFLRYGLMDNGSIWGHGGYLGIDYSAEALHQMSLQTAEALAQQQYDKPMAALDATQRAGVQGQVAQLLKTNRYDAATQVLTLTPPEVAAWKAQLGYWTNYFEDPENNGGLSPNWITDPQQLRQFTAFVTWAAWASVANRPGESYSYTMNFPYDPSVGNVPAGNATFWSALSLVVFLIGLGAALLASGRFEYLGWISAGKIEPRVTPGVSTKGQRALVKFFVIVAAVWLFQTLVGGATAHYRIEPGGFYGIPLERIFPSNLMRTWHLQSAVMWIATSYVAAALFLGSTLRKQVPEALTRWANLLFAAFLIVIVGSLVGEWAGMLQWFGSWWFWLGNQGWEYLELGRLWQYVLVIGLVVWFAVLWWLARPRDNASVEARPVVRMFLLAALSIPLFYLPALFYGAHTNFTVVDTWRFWIIHLWVEGFFEFFATTVVAIVFYQLGLARVNTALRVIYLDAILFFLGGLVGTGHHWYFNGHSSFNMAASALVSVLEVVPLTLLTLDAWGFIKTARGGDQNTPRAKIAHDHKWTLFFLIAVGFWNFLGAGVFGFLVNLPIVSYFETGTQLTPNHGHASLMGVFGMLAIALMVFVLRQTASDRDWPGIERWVKYTFWGANIGLMMMVAFSLFPSGLRQVWDVTQHGYWHARSMAFIHQPTALIIEWLRLPGDLVFIIFGSIPLTIAAFKAWAGVRRQEAD